MFDNLQGRFLNCCHFGVRSNGSILRVLARLSFLTTLSCLGGCSSQPKSGTVEDSITSGRILVVCAPEAYGLIAREASAFKALYPRAAIQVDAGSSRQAVSSLLAATTDLAVITRELEPEERQAALRGGVALQGYRFARDALVVIVNPSNRVENAAIEDVRHIYKGEMARWSEMGGGDWTVEPVIQPLQSDITSFFTQEVMGGGPVTAAVVYEGSDSAVVARVRRDAGAIGYVSLGGASGDCRVLRISSLQGLSYWKPDLEAVYRGDYPLTRYFNVYVRASGRRLANGFITFMTSVDGQRLVREAGLVPTAVPVRFVRRSPMMSGHR